MYIIKPGKEYDFMGMRKYFLVLSAILLSVSAIAIFKPGPRWGTDFKGGTEIEIAFKKPVGPGEVREAVESITDQSGARQFDTAEVIAVPNKPTQYLIRVQEVSAISEPNKQAISQKMCFAEQGKAADCTPDMTPSELKFSPGGDKITLRYDWLLDSIDSTTKDEKGLTPQDYKVQEYVAAVKARIEGSPGITLIEGDKAIVLASVRDRKIDIHLKSKGDQLLEGIKKKFGPEIAPDEPLRIEWIGPKAGEQLRDSAFKSIGIAVFFIMAYIALRFDLRFAPGAIVALIHDVLISVGAMCLAGKEITLPTVAAILTILGYSLTDTVVVYDRIRENLGRHRGMTFSHIVNLSVSEMFGRTLITSLTAANSMVMFLIFGTQLIKDFAFVMLVGIAVGTYSSIYIAAPFTEWVDRRFFADKGQKARPKPSRTRGTRRADAVV